MRPLFGAACADALIFFLQPLDGIIVDARTAYREFLHCRGGQAGFGNGQHGAAPAAAGRAQLFFGKWNGKYLGMAGSSCIACTADAVFGGIGSIPGALIGGILLGVIENLSKAYISSQLSDAIVFAVLIIVLLVRPTGIQGKKITEKV